MPPNEVCPRDTTPEGHTNQITSDLDITDVNQPTGSVAAALGGGLMSGGRFDKFEWIRAVSADSRLAASERLILVNVALFSVLGGEDTFCTKQTTIALRCGTTDRQVRRAITAGRSNGYVVLVEERQRGRGYHRGDEYRLLLPVIPDNLSAINDAGRRSASESLSDGIPDRSNRNTGQIEQEYRTDRTGIPDRSNRNTGQIEQQ
jgi:hypothetical protein